MASSFHTSPKSVIHLSLCYKEWMNDANVFNQVYIDLS